MQKDKRILFSPVGINYIWKFDNIKAADGVLGKEWGSCGGKGRLREGSWEVSMVYVYMEMLHYYEQLTC